ncbi:MAG: DUF460 domain-containing protein [Methanomicrobiales archaeon]|jgi:predicted RNase H-like nuclease (RuvC/YqgF family)|nr:DUF460 domain-containing protein [Methanomicrobiales archaeon]
MQLIRREEPRVLACDSLTEIAKKEGDIYSIAAALPRETKLVVVTGAGSERISLVAVAKRYNISFDRFDPFAEARASAMVASRGAGFEVVAFGDETLISVSRRRSLGKGGWSQNRYARKIHGHVLVRSRLIAESLDTAGLSYTRQEFRAFGGVSRVVFTAKARREQIPVSNQSSGDVRVIVEGKRLDRISFTPVTKKPGFVIVGFDPGTTLGIAIVDLSGKLLNLRSSRQMSLSDATSFIASIGRPVVIASDVNPMPFSVEKIRRSFHAVPYTPNHDLSVEAKYALTKEDNYANDHERDALSAARAAYQFWSNRFLGIARRIPEGTDLDEVYAGIIQGQSVEQILHGKKRKQGFKDKKSETIEESTDEDSEVSKKHLERIRVLEGVVKDLRTLLQKAHEEAESKDKEISELKGRQRAMQDERYLTLQRDIEIHRRDASIKSLKKRLRAEERNNKKLYKRIKRLQDPSEVNTVGIRCGVISDLSKELVKQYLESPGWQDGLDNGIIYVHTIASWSRTVIAGLQDAGISVLVYGGETKIDPRLLDACCDLSLPLIKCAEFSELRGKIEIGHGTLREDILSAALREWEKTEQRYHTLKKSQEIEDLFTTYKAERELEVRKMK